ncbi:MAG: hypothetical protein WC992_01035 [Acholeplasmataceae bacterium]|jgi:hypothetical protein|nr:hypothetical protein [Acholeplasmataceae bacterium]
MNPFTIVFLSVSSLIFLFGLYALFFKKKHYWIPILLPHALGIMMILLGQTVQVSGGSFADVMYTILGVLAHLIALVIGLITVVLQHRKEKLSV